MHAAPATGRLRPSRPAPGTQAGPTARIGRTSGMPGRAGAALLVVAVLVGCTAASTITPVPPAAASPASVPGAETASPSPSAVASPSAVVASPSPATASPAAAGSPTPTTGTGRYGGGGSGATPSPTARPTATPKPTPDPTPKPASIVVKAASTSVGKALVGPNGLTLYTLSTDPRNGSGCSGSCADNWPPFMVKSGTVVKGGSGVGGTFGTFARSGKRQVTYQGRALYYFAGDAYAGDANGQGINGVWYVAKP